MPRFRPMLAVPATALPTPEVVRRLVADALHPAHFLLGDGLALEGEHRPAEEVPWEIFRGRLLDPRQTRERRSFEAWNLWAIEDGARSGEPLLSVKFDAEAGQLHVVRAIHCYAWEGYDAGGNVIESREVRKWVRELVGTIDLARFPSAEELHDEMICLLFQAVIGTSRLPLTSVEAPLPAFSLGRLAYCYQHGGTPAVARLDSWQAVRERMQRPDLCWLEKVKLLEAALLSRAGEDAEAAAGSVALMAWGPDWEGRLLELFRALFNEAALSPYTHLADRVLAALSMLEVCRLLSTANLADLLGHLLRQLGRHLTAYDLVIFHHSGANYPDALVLDALLKAYLERIERRPDLFLAAPGDTEAEAAGKRLRRRALRQAWLLRRRYEGHPVPDVPTSPGENVRVLPPPFVRVPEEQILYPHRRNRRLYDNDPLDRHLSESGRAVLCQSLDDLHHPTELRELGLAVFLDRPLGAGKAPTEPDGTLLLSYLAFSRSIARQRLRFLAETLRLLSEEEHAALRQLLDGLEVVGLPLDSIVGSPRPGGVCLADARKAADDFLFLRLTQRAARDFFGQYPLDELTRRFPLEDLRGGAPVLIVRSQAAEERPRIGLALYDARLRQRLEMDFDPRLGYARRGGVEYPLSPLRVLRVWASVEGSDELREHDVRSEPILLRPAEQCERDGARTTSPI